MNERLLDRQRRNAPAPAAADLPPMPKSITQLRLDHSRMVETVADASRVFGLRPEAALLLASLGAKTAISTKLRADGHYTGHNATYNLKSLEEKQLIERTPAYDQRERPVRLTAEGLKIAAVIRLALAQFARKMEKQ